MVTYCRAAPHNAGLTGEPPPRQTGEYSTARSAEDAGGTDKRTPDRSLAAPDHFILIDLAGLAQRPTITASGWRQITADCTGPRVFWRKDVATGFGQALVLNGDKCTVLHNVDDWGGYGRKQQGDDAVALLPELAGEIERHRLECAASREACRRFLEAARFDDPCWDEIPF